MQSNYCMSKIGMPTHLYKIPNVSTLCASCNTDISDLILPPDIQDLPLTTPHGVTYFRYEEYTPGKWRYLGEFPAQGDATEESKPAKPRTID